MATLRAWAWGVVAGAVILLGYSLFPNGTQFEWTVVILAFFAGLAFGIFHSRPAPWREIGNAALASSFLIVAGTATRMWLNDLTMIDTVLLLRNETYAWGFLLPFGYWLLIGTVGYALTRYFRKPVLEQHAP